MKIKKILFIITHLELGGAQKQLFSIIESLNQDKYSIHLYSGSKGHLKNKGDRLLFLKKAACPLLIRDINPFYDFIAFWKLYLYIKKNKFDIVHTHSPKASILGRWAAYLAGVKNIVYTVHGWPFHKFMNPLAYCFYLFLERITAKITKKIIVVSNADLKRGVENKVAEAKKFALIHYGINMEKFDNARNEKSYAKKKGTVEKKRGQATFFKKSSLSPFLNCPLLLNVSALKVQKGVGCFLEAAKMLLGEFPELKFMIVGDGPLRKKIENKIKLMGLEGKVCLRGWVDDINELLKTTSIFILTSLWEGLPVSLIEAVACGIPAVVTDTGGVRDIMQDQKQGLIVEPNNPLAVKEACRKMLKSYGNWSRIVETNREKVGLCYWSEQRMVKETESLYAQL